MQGRIHTYMNTTGFLSSEVVGRKIHFRSILQSFQKERVEPLLRRYEDARKLGQELVRSAATNVRTTDLESDLDRLDSTWSALNEKVGTAGTSVVKKLRGLKFIKSEKCISKQVVHI